MQSVQKSVFRQFNAYETFANTFRRKTVSMQALFAEVIFFSKTSIGAFMRTES